MGRMNRPVAAEILILAGQRATAERWAAMLEDPFSRIWLATEDVPDPDRLDLILTDRKAPEEPQAGACRKWHLGEGATRSTSPGVIRIGAEGPG